MTTYQPALYINGTFRTEAKTSGAVLNPATGETIGKVPFADAGALDEAIAAAEKAFPAWAAMPAYDRGAILRKAAGLVRERVKDLARILTLEQGKVFAEARGELLASAEIFEWYAEEARRNYGRLVPPRQAGMRQMVIGEPVGPAAAFTPWNFPALTPTRKIAGALAAGCTLILKAAEETPGTAFELVRACADAGLPAGVLNLVFGDPAQVSKHLIGSPAIRKISFTGSVAVGKELTRLSAQHLQRTTMELGGHAPVIVCADFDPDLAGNVAAAGKYRNAGQVCVSPSRFFVHESIFEKFTDRFVAYAKGLKVGDGLAEGTTMGPLANDRRLQAMDKFVADAKARGGQVRTGGARIGNRGFFFEPTVVTGIADDAMLMTTEPFGPIAPIVPFKEVDEVIARANNISVGLAGYAFTKNTTVAEKLASGVRVGMLGINTLNIASTETPFGGVKESGSGSEGGIEGLEAYLEIKLVSILG